MWKKLKLKQFKVFIYNEFIYYKGKLLLIYDVMNLTIFIKQQVELLGVVIIVIAEPINFVALIF